MWCGAETRVGGRGWQPWQVGGMVRNFQTMCGEVRQVLCNPQAGKGVCKLTDRNVVARTRSRCAVEEPPVPSRAWKCAGQGVGHVEVWGYVQRVKGGKVGEGQHQGKPEAVVGTCPSVVYKCGGAG